MFVSKFHHSPQWWLFHDRWRLRQSDKDDAETTESHKCNSAWNNWNSWVWDAHRLKKCIHNCCIRNKIVLYQRNIFTVEHQKHLAYISYRTFCLGTCNTNIKHLHQCSIKSWNSYIYLRKVFLYNTNLYLFAPYFVLLVLGLIVYNVGVHGSSHYLGQ